MLRRSLIFLVFVTAVCGWRSAFDEELYENVLDAATCQEQLTFLTNNSLGLRFLDSSGKVPPGLLSGNLNDLGDYYQCLSIDAHAANAHHIEGKYCTVLIPLEQEISLPEIPVWPNITWPDIPWPENWPPVPTPDNSTREMFVESVKMQHWAQTLAGVGTPRQPVIKEGNNQHSRILPVAITVRSGAMLAVCVPRVCSARQAFDFFLATTPIFNLTYHEYYCRLPDDRPFAPADYVAIAIFSLIALLVILSTSYDLLFKFVFKKPTSNLARSFSVYTNTKRLLTFNPVPDAVECMDGIRAISMVWVVVGHTYSLSWLGFLHNVTESVAWLRLFTSTWVTSSPLTVDTFFLLSGILVVYSTIGKLSRGRFIRVIHLFYINRILRTFPLLATVVLLQASVFNYVSDGPFWQNVAHATENCRQYWWSALLHVQNYVNPLEICLAHTWYLSVDTQLYFFCPIVLVWLFGNKLYAWSSLCLILVLSLVSSSIYSFTYNFTAALVQPNRMSEFDQYVQIYYINTLTRASPFFVGMIFGYILHLYRGRRIRIAKVNVFLLWVLAGALICFCVFSTYPVMQLDHTAQTFDNLLNSYMRALWAVGLGSIIFACAHGYGGPVNWFLSLSMWKLPARLSFAMYLIHFPIMVIANSSWVKTYYFTNGQNLYRLSSDLFITFVAAFILCIFIDAPFSTLQKELLGNGKKKTPVAASESQDNINRLEEKSKL